MPSDPGSTRPLSRFDVLGLSVSAINMAQALDTIDTWVRDRTPHYVCISGVHGVMESRRDEGLRRIHAEHPELPVIMVTARDSAADRAALLAAGAAGYVTKPFGVTALTEEVRRALGGTPAGAAASAR